MLLGTGLQSRCELQTQNNRKLRDLIELSAIIVCWDNHSSRVRHYIPQPNSSQTRCIQLEMVENKPTRYHRLVQVDIRQPMDAMGHFNAKVTDGRIPLVLVPSYPIFFTFMQQIPSGVWVLQQTWNAHSGVMNPGMTLFSPAWNRVSHIVTKQAVAYSNPVRGCPTSDNVMIDIDISISFQIGPTEDDAVKFVYSLGAHCLDELLYSLTEEAIRGLVNSVRYDQVHDLREDFATGMKRDLNEKLVHFGVFIHNVKVTDVELPASLSSTLEGTTAFKTRMGEQEKNHENQLRILLNEETQKLTAVQKRMRERYKTC